LNGISQAARSTIEAWRAVYLYMVISSHSEDLVFASMHKPCMHGLVADHGKGNASYNVGLEMRLLVMQIVGMVLNNGGVKTLDTFHG
jgi:hypothetical protein